MKDIVELTEQTTCSKCGGLLGVGISVRCEFDTEIDGYIHRHRNGCRRAADHHLIMEVIENAKHTPSPKAEADKGNKNTTLEKKYGSFIEKEKEKQWRNKNNQSRQVV